MLVYIKRGYMGYEKKGKKKKTGDEVIIILFNMTICIT